MTQKIEKKVETLLHQIRYDEMDEDQIFEQIETDIDDFQIEKHANRKVGMYINLLNQKLSRMGYTKIMRGIVDYLIEEETEDSKYLGDLYHEMVTINFFEGAYDNAMVILENELSIRENIGDQVGYAMATHTKGVLNQVLNKLEAAEKYYLKSYELGKNIDNYAMKDRMIHSLANLYLNHLAEFEKSFQYYNNGLELAKNHKDKMKQSFYLDHLGMVEYWQKNYNEAIKYHEDSFEIINKLEEKPINLLFNQVQFAMNYNKLEEYDKALKHLMSVTDYKRINTDTYSNVWYNIIISEILYEEPSLLEPYELDLEELIGELDHDLILKNTISMADQGNFAPGSVISRLYRSRHNFEKNPELAITLLSEAKQIATAQNRVREIKLIKEHVDNVGLDYKTI